LHFLCSFKGTYYSIALNENTPTANPPAFSLIQPGNSAAGVQLTYQNGFMDTAPVTTVFKFICSVSRGKTAYRRLTALQAPLSCACSCL
jgi:hypothetical protein